MFCALYFVLCVFFVFKLYDQKLDLMNDLHCLILHTLFENTLAVKMNREPYLFQGDLWIPLFPLSDSNGMWRSYE